MQCALCRYKECRQGKNCTLIKSKLEYGERELQSLQTSAQIQAGAEDRTKLEEIVIYAKKMGYQKIGLAFSIEWEREARLAYRVLSRYFEVFSVCCKVCGFEKEDFELVKSEGSESEAACNPLGQALLLNEDGTELNLMLGLNTGIDVLFSEKSIVPVITLPVEELEELDYSGFNTWG